MDHGSLSELKVSELRELCRERRLLVSGKKADLIQRILEDEGLAEPIESPAPAVSTTPQDRDEMDDAIDRLLARHSGEEPTEIPPDLPPAPLPEPLPEAPESMPQPPPPVEEVLEAEVLEADIVEEAETVEVPETIQVIPPAPAIEEESALILDEEASGILILDKEEVDPWTTGVIPEEDSVLLADELASDSDSEASITITIPSLRSIELSAKQVAAIAVVGLIIVAAGIAIYVQQESVFRARELRYGDSMQFVIHSSSISIEGDDMVSIFRDAAGGALDDACGEINVVISTGSGSILIRKGTADDILHPMDAQYSGAVSALDAFGRYHLTAEKVLTHDLSIDLSGKTWRNPGECGNQGWFLEDNSLDMTSRSWTDIGDREMIKTRTDLTLRDVDDKPTTLEAATFGLEAISGLDIVGSYILFPLTPIDLYAFFGERELRAGSNSEESDKWSWSVDEEINDPNHGLVYLISLSHKEFDICNGHVRIDLKVKKGVPWPVSQEASIIVDKSQGTSECGLVESTLSDAAMPDGRITIQLSMRATNNHAGTRSIDWGVGYTSKPGPGEDRPSTSAQRSWGVAMPDESDTRVWDIEAALQCTLANHPSSGAALAVESGGYIWKASTKQVDSEQEWNLSWVADDDRTGLTIVRKQDDGCALVVDRNTQNEAVKWNRNAIPDTLTMSVLENRILASARYPDLNPLISDGAGGWHSESEYGYILSVTHENDIFDFIPSSFAEGTVNVGVERTWTEGNKEHSVSFAMDAENGRMLGWFHIY